MRTLARRLVLLALLSLPIGAAAQQPSGQAPAATPAGEADPGVRPVRLIDRDEIRVSRVELQPGAVRRVHAHDDVEYHVWAPVSGSLEITIGNEPPKAAAPGQAFFMKKGTPHGFRNTGTTPAAVFEIPLLFETGGEGAFDTVIVVSAPLEAQRERVLKRPGMTAAKLAAIFARQLPDEDKRARADFVIDTGGDLSTTERQVRDILACLGLAPGR